MDLDSSDDDVVMADVDDMDAFETMRQSASDQNFLRIPWGEEKGKRKQRVPCRNELETKRRPPAAGQTRLLGHAIRPERWSAEPFKLDEDILQLIAEALMPSLPGLSLIHI